MFYYNHFQGTRKLLQLIMKNLLGCLSIVICFAIPVAITCALAAWRCDIEPDKTYTWYSGIWHGLFCIPNWIRSFFYSDVLCKANYYTTGYNVWWWITFIWVLLGIVAGGGKARN